MVPSRRLLALALAALASACDRGGGPADGRAPVWWVGEAGAPRLLGVDAAGELTGVVAGPPSLDAPVRALAARADGAIAVLQEVTEGAPPGVVLSRGGERLLSLAAVDGGGAPLFEVSSPPWAAAEDRAGALWVTGREAPVRFDARGAFLGRAAALPYPTRGVAALADGRVLVTFGVHRAALYAAGGASFELLDAGGLGAGAPVPYLGLDAAAAREDGTLLLAVLRHGLTADGVVVAATVEGGALVPAGDPEAAPRLPTLPSSLALGPDGVVAGPSLGSLAGPTCAERLAPDLSAREGCLVAGAHRGVVRVR